MRVIDAMRDARLNAIKTQMETGSNFPELAIYGSSYPTNITDSPGGTALAVILLNDPIGSIVNHQLVFTLPSNQVVTTAGTAVWGRLNDGNGAVVLDAMCGVTGSGAVIELQTLDLIQGVLLPAIEMYIAD